MKTTALLTSLLCAATALVPPAHAQTSSAPPAPSVNAAAPAVFAPARPASTPLTEWAASVKRINVAGDLAEDRKTGLVWTRCPVGQQYDRQERTCQGTATLMTLTEAQAYAAKQPGGWRVPTSEDLLTILPAACPPSPSHSYTQPIGTGIRGQRVISASRSLEGGQVLMPEACTTNIKSEPASSAAVVLLATSSESVFWDKRREEGARLSAQYQAAREAERARAASAPRASEPVRIQEQQSGTVTRYRIEGSLEPTRDLACLPGDRLQPGFTPPDLHTGFLKCLSEERASDALMMFLTAGIYSRFDALRVNDPSVRGGPQVLIMNTSATFTPKQRAFFGEQVQPLIGKPAMTQAWCATLRRLGPPNYFPRYLVLHGLRAYTVPDPLANALVPDFDADAAWKKLLDSYAHCPN